MIFKSAPKAISILLFGVLASLEVVNAQPITSCPVSQITTGLVPSLTEKYEVSGNGIRVFYTLAGEHALVIQTDLNGNGVPDYVENVEKQADAARKAYNLVGFRDPLESGRYRAATHIDINLGNIAGGAAYSEPGIWGAVPQRGGVCAIRIDLSSGIANYPGTWSIMAHEMFHLFQYGYSMMKRSWFIEPTANWAERIIRTGTMNHPDPTQKLPQTMEEMQTTVFSQTYPYNFWSRLAKIMDPAEDSIDLPEELRNATYVDGSLIFKDDKIRGFGFLSRFYQYLDAEDAVVSQLYGWPEYDWGSGNQNHAMHDARVLKVIQRAISSTGMKNHQQPDQVYDDIEGFLTMN